MAEKASDRLQRGPFTRTAIEQDYFAAILFSY
jgi:hypothetical protein